jgi:Holliday junction DNA helicase RuvA
MITGIRGTLEETTLDSVKVQVGGVSLRVYVPVSTLSELGPPGGTIHLHTHLDVKEDSLTLYGFSNTESLRIFQLLLGVSGIGPRLALALISAMGPYNLASAIASGDEVGLSQVSGVGKKTAARIVLELGEKLQKEDIEPSDVSAPDGETVAALMALGYSAQEARSALRTTDLPMDASLEERLQEALQHIND